MPRWDYRCEACGHIQESGDQAPICPICEVFWAEHGVDYGGFPPSHEELQMTRLPAAPNFSIHGYNTKNGYSK